MLAEICWCDVSDCPFTITAPHLYAMPDLAIASSNLLIHPKSPSINTHNTTPPSHPSIYAMPPRLQALCLASARLAKTSTAPILAPFLAPVQQRSASILSSLSDTKGAYHKRIRRGRGPASGKGKTAGRGQKGQHAHGKVPAGFQGGQTPLEITKPERGRNKYNP